MDENFKKQIATDFGLSSMPATEQDKMIERIGNMLFEAVVERSIDEMGEETINQFEDLLGGVGQDYQKVINFLRTNVSSFNNIVSDEMARLKRATSGIFA